MKKILLLMMSIVLISMISAATYIEPFDLKTIFLNYFLGDTALFPFAFIIVLSLISGFFQIPDKIFLVLLVIGSVMMGAYMGQIWYTLILLFVGFILYKIFSRIFE